MRCVDVVIVNWNSGIQAKEAVEAILVQRSTSVASIVVVDNASSDGSVELIPDDNRVKIVKNAQNVGFGAACNTGARSGSAHFILLLNPDTRVEPDTISSAVAFMQSPIGEAYTTCGVKLYDESGKIQRHCARIPGMRSLVGEATGLSAVLPKLFPPIIMTEFDHLQSRDVPHVIGAFYLVRRDAFEQVNGFDEEFFVYYEDLDLSKRMYDRGGRIRYLADTRCFHKGGGTSESIKARRLAYSMESRLRFAYKHLPSWQSRLVEGLMLFVEPTIRRVHAMAISNSGTLNEINIGLAYFRQRRPNRTSTVRITR